jgi:hypothetical protein
MKRATALMVTTLGIPLCLFATAALGVPISYSYSGVGSGSLGGASFANASFSVVLKAETAAITPPALGNQIYNTSTAVVTITGLPAVTISGVRVYQFAIPPTVLGIELRPQGGGFADVLYFFDPANRLSYNLADPFGPYTSPTLGALGLYFHDVPTTGGLLNLAPVGAVTFVATPSLAVPINPWLVEVVMLAIAAWALSRRHESA